MQYIPDDTCFTIEQVERRILDTDLIPSMEVLKSCISGVCKKILHNKIENLEKLRNVLKTKTKLHTIAVELEINDNYLVLLKREIDGWKPKIRRIDEFSWINLEEIRVLKANGIMTSEDAYNHFSNKKERGRFTNLGVNNSTIEEVYRISSLLRVRWISPTLGRVINEIGYDVGKLKKANAEMLTKAIDDYNKEKGYYKGKVGLRDVNRLIFEAKYVN